MRTRSTSRSIRCGDRFVAQTFDRADAWCGGTSDTIFSPSKSPKPLKLQTVADEGILTDSVRVVKLYTMKDFDHTDDIRNA
jgi:hypothetical protein